MPTPHALPIILSPKQREILNKLVQASTTPQREVIRGKIVLLSSDGLTNDEIAKRLQLDHQTARLWRERWHQATLNEIEGNLDDKQLKAVIRQILSDKARPGVSPKFDAEQVVQIMALACENPQEVGYPVSHWTPELLAVAAVEHEIVESISPGSIRNFLKKKPN